MKFKNMVTDDVLEVPPPYGGMSVVRFNGRIVERVFYAESPFNNDADGGTTTTEDGRVFRGAEWAEYLIEKLRTGAWKQPPEARGE